MDVINLAEKLGRLPGPWQPRIVAEVGDSYVKVAKLEGEFDWHRHEDEDELFLVLAGTLAIELRERTLTLREGELAVIPKGTDHRPVTDGEVSVLLVEPKTTRNTGEQVTDRTVSDAWL